MVDRVRGRPGANGCLFLPGRPRGSPLRLFIHPYGDAVQVIDTSNDTVIQTIPIGQSPQALVYVARSGDGSDGRADLTKQGTGKKVEKLKLVVPKKPFAFLPQALADASGSAVIRELEGTDQIDIDVDGLPANAVYLVFLTEKAGAPFGAVQYVPGSDGKPDVAATEGSRKRLAHLGIWPADPQTLASVFAAQGQPNAVSPFDDDGQAGPAILVDAVAGGGAGMAVPPSISPPVVQPPLPPAVVPPASGTVPGMPRTGVASGNTGGLAVVALVAMGILSMLGVALRRKSSAPRMKG